MICTCTVILHAISPIREYSDLIDLTTCVSDDSSDGDELDELPKVCVTLASTKSKYVYSLIQKSS